MREFSKEHSKHERAELAHALWEKRRNHFENQLKTKERIAKLKQELTAKSSGSEHILDELKTVNQQIEEDSQSLFTRIWHMRRLGRMQEKKKEFIKLQGAVESDYTGIRDALEEAESELNLKVESDEAWNMLESFYGAESEKLAEYRKEMRERSITTVAEKQKVYVVHALNPYSAPGENSPLHQNVDWKTKLKLLLAFNPTLSCSTVKSGDTRDNLWSYMGVVLSDGVIEHALAHDSASVAEGRNKRRVSGRLYGDKVEDIERAIRERQPNHYNELVVRNPKVAGLFYYDEPPNNAMSGAYVKPEEIAQVAEELGLPLYALKDGELSEAKFNLYAKNILKGSHVNHEDITKIDNAVSEDLRERIIDEICEDSPFREYIPDMYMVDASSEGRSQYISLVRNQNGLRRGNTIIPLAEGSELFDKRKILKNNQIISEHARIGGKIRYAIHEGRLYVIDTQRRQKEQAILRPAGVERVRIDTVMPSSYHSEYIDLGAGTHKLDREIKDIESYLEGMRNAFEYVKKRQDEDLRSKEDEKRQEFYNEWFQKLVYHLHGFGEQAKEFGDEETERKAFEIANKFVPLEDRRMLITKRVDSDGKVKLTRDEAEKFLA